MYGDTGRIGLICPGVTPSIEMDFHQHLPEGLALSTTRVPYREVTMEGLQEMSDQVVRAAAAFKGFPMDLVCFCCTTGSMVGGSDYDRRLVADIEAACGIPALTTSTALMQAFQAMKVQSVAIATPYSGPLNEMEAAFLAANGYHTTTIEGLGHTDTRVIPFVRPEEIYALARRQDVRGADALFISCTGICALDCIEPLERELGIPVLTSNQATIWGCLRKIGYAAKVPGLGRLFEI